MADPALHWHNLHEIVTERDREDRHGRYVEHGVELAHLTDEGNILKVLVKEFIDLAWVANLLTIWQRAGVFERAKGNKGKEALSEKKDGGDDVCCQEHLADGFLWSNWVNDAWDGVMVDKNEHSVAEYSC